MSSVLFGILQLDRGEPYGFGNVTGLVQAWLQDAGGFAMVGLVVYLIYAMATPTDKSQSEKIRVPVTQFMVVMAAVALLCYAGWLALIVLEYYGQTTFLKMPISRPVFIPETGAANYAPPPRFHTEIGEILMMVAGAFALLGICDPFARDAAKIARRNLSPGFAGVRRAGRSFGASAAGLFSGRRRTVLLIAFAAYLAAGAALYALGASRLFGIWAGWLLVAFGVLVGIVLVHLLFEAEGPVWAIAKLSFKEASRSGLLWLFLLVLVPFAFQNVWMARTKPVDEVRTLVDVTSLWMSILVVVSAALFASFYGIPNDIKNLNIYTVVSKPIERFEIVLGRFVGYVALMTLVLVGLTGVSLVLISNTNLSEKAKAETYKARVPVRGKLEFKSRRADFEGTNVGREFDYRRYIAGHPESAQRAIWHYTSIPSGLTSTEGDRVPVEFTFDIYRMTKGEQNKGVNVSFRFVTHNAPQQPPRPDQGGEWQWADSVKDREREYRAEVDRLQAEVSNLEGARPGDKAAWAAANQLAEKYGFFEIRQKEVFDYAVMGVEVPTGLFRNALSGPQPKDRDGKPLPRLSVYVKCESPGQLLGMAEPDLYLLEYEQPFALNYAKGMVGVWCWACIVIGLAVACSTYLSSVLSLLAASVIFLFGFFPEHLNEVATNRNVGGGPFESMSRTLRAEMPTAPLAESAGTKALTLFDHGAAWLFRRVINVIPDAEMFNWTPFVSEGFNISAEYLVLNVLVTVGYLLPWAVLAYYLMKSREVAA
jgi:ABC-type transport system involved in multi-copper enzyme maturation permease subunit